MAHEGHDTKPATKQAGVMRQQAGVKQELGMAAAIDAKGVLWTLARENAAEGNFAILRSSEDGGQSWSAPHRIHSKAEPIAADGDNRPKLAFGPKGEFYATWTTPTSKNYTGDIRFTRSTDGGRNWSPLINVHQDRQRITHRFDSLFVAADGRLYVTWIDKRDGIKAQQQGLSYDGAALYYAVSDDGGAHWKGDFKIADHSCECCRISLAPGPDGAPVAFWRHVFAGSERDHAMVTLTPDGKLDPISRATFDHWKIAACPHHGPALAIGHDNGVPVRHAVWYTQNGEEGRVYYGRLASSAAAFASASDNKPAGQRSLPDGAEHADIAASGSKVWMVWKRFDGQQTVVGLMQSADGGVTWAESVLASTTGSSDHPHLQVHAQQAWLVWNTEKQGPLVRRLP